MVRHENMNEHPSMESMEVSLTQRIFSSEKYYIPNSGSRRRV